MAPNSVHFGVAHGSDAAWHGSLSEELPDRGLLACELTH